MNIHIFSCFLSRSQVKDLYLHPEMFSVSNGLLTPTLKSRRVDLRRVFSEQIAQMYTKSSVQTSHMITLSSDFLQNLSANLTRLANKPDATDKKLCSVIYEDRRRHISASHVGIQIVLGHLRSFRPDRYTPTLIHSSGTFGYIFKDLGTDELITTSSFSVSFIDVYESLKLNLLPFIHPDEMSVSSTVCK